MFTRKSCNQHDVTTATRKNASYKDQNNAFKNLF